MPLPRFFSRVHDAIAPVAAVDPDTLGSHLHQRVLVLQAPSGEDPDTLGGPLLAANLAARLYPRIHLTGPPAWSAQAARTILAINPGADVTDGHQPTGSEALTLSWDPATSVGPRTITVAAAGWSLWVDPAIVPQASPHPLASLAAAAVGMGEAFRTAFADTLAQHGRRGPQPGGFHLLQLGEPEDAPHAQTDPLLPPTHLVGAGAIGQACLLGLVAARAAGEVTVVDPETVTLSNLQRYVLTTDTDVGAAKTAMAARATASSALHIHEVPTRWGDDQRSGPGATQAAVALDTAADRIAVAAGLPQRVYNAWTQPADIGWSRHERFGTQPCLACLYYPTTARPGEHELIGAALGQHPLRTLTYLVHKTPVGQPLPGLAQVTTLPPPPEAAGWLQRSLLQDLVAAGRLRDSEVASWATHTLGGLYRDGICAGGLLSLRPHDGEAVVPLAHQSALAGIMLATQLVAATDDGLRAIRHPATEARLDMLRRLPQRLARPRTRTEGCLCADSHFLAAASA